MRIKAVFMAVLAMLVTAPSASADLLCIKKSQRIKGAKVSLASVLQTATSTCPAGYVPVLDTDLFQGPQGPKGADGRVNWSSCYAKSKTAQSDAEGYAVVDLYCNNQSTQFLLVDGYSYTPDTRPIYLDTRDYLVNNTDKTVPVGVSILTGSFNTAGYNLTVWITCCSR